MCLKCRDQTKKVYKNMACIHGKARFTCRDPECVRKVVLSVEETYNIKKNYISFSRRHVHLVSLPGRKFIMRMRQ